MQRSLTQRFGRCIAALGAAALFSAVHASDALAQTVIPASTAQTLSLPQVSGDGVFVEVFNQIGGGPPPTPADVATRQPTGVTNSPFVWFPNPGPVISVGNPFATFFANTTTPPNQLTNTAALNFIMRITGLIRIEQSMDRDPNTPGIQMTLSVGSDDGFDLRVGGILLGTAGDRGFSFSDMPVTFEQPGLYPYTLLFSANAVGASGLQFAWVTQPTAGNRQIIPQAFLYRNVNQCQQQFTFDDLPAGSSDFSSYAARGLSVITTDPNVQVTNTRPARFVPITPPNVLADVRENPPRIGVVTFQFRDSTGNAGYVNYFETYIINATGPGARVTGTDAAGNTLFDQVIVTDGAGQQRVVINQPFLTQVSVLLGSGADNAALDSVCIGTVQTAQFVDLRVAAFTPDATAVVGQQITAPFVINNAGTAPTSGPWTNALFLKPAGASGPGDQVAIVTDPGTTPLAPSQSRPAQSFTFTAPNSAGQYTLRAQTDIGRSQNEGPFAANNSTVERDLQVLDSADLTVANGSISIPGQVLGGSTQSIGYRIVNSAPAGSASATGTVVDRIYASLDPVLGTGNSVLLAEVSYAIDLSPGQGVDRAVSVQVPLLNLQGFVIVQTNFTGSIYEFGPARDNNVRSAGPIQIVTPDLRPTAISPPANATFGGTITVPYSVLNEGFGPATGAWNDRFFLSSDATLSGDDIALDPVVSVSGPISPAGTYGSSAVLNLPTRVTGGQFFVLVRVNDNAGLAEVNNANNILASGPITIAGAPAPSLSVANVSAPPSATWGRPITVRYSINNNGQLPSTAAFIDGVYVNSAPTLVGATRIGQNAGLVVQPGISAAREVTVNTPPRFDGDGSFFLLVRVDDLQQQADPNRDDNTGASAAVVFTATPSVDFRADSIAGPSAADDGQPATVSWTITNIGTLGANPQWGDRVYLSPTPTFNSATARVLGDFVRTLSLPPGASYTRTEQVSIPAGLSGNWWLVVTANVGGTVAEPLGTANNTVVSAAPVNIRQGQLPDLLVSSINLGTEVYVGRSTSVTYFARNAGPGTVNGAWRDRIFFGPDNPANPTSLDGLTLLTERQQFTTLAPGVTYGNSAPLLLPATPGRYRVVVALDVGQNINQVDRTNDIRVQTIDVIAPEYTAVASTDFVQGPLGSPVAITGAATRAEGGPAANVPVNINLVVRGVKRVIRVTTDAAGAFSTTFQPLPNEAGQYALFATHPAQFDLPAQDNFVIHGMLATPAGQPLRVTPGEAASVSFTVRNVGDLPLTNVRAAVSDVPSGVSISADVPAIIPPQTDVTLRLDVSAQLGATGTSFPRVTLAADQPASAAATLSLELAPPAAQLVAEPTSIRLGMVRGRLTPVSVTVRNVGGRPTGPLTVASSAAPWLSQVTPPSLPSLEPGQSVDVNLSLSPPIDLPLGPYSGSIVVASTAQTLAIPFTFNCVSLGRGSLDVRIENELTYFGAGNPTLAGASVEVRDRLSGLVIASAVSGSDGIARFSDLPESVYDISATAPNHGGATTSLVLIAGRTNFATLFLSQRLVSYEWTVVPTTIRDQYNITINATFATNVPLPVVTIEPAYVDLRDLTAGSRQINFTIRNNGLIAARDVGLRFSSNAQYAVQPLLDTIGELPANSQIVIPVTFSRTEAGGGPCVGISLQAVHTIICGVPRQYLVPVVFALDNPNCPGGGIAGGGGGGGGGGGAGGVSGPPGVTQPVVCDPCTFKCGQAAFNCVLPGPIGCALGLLEGCLGVNPIFGTDPGSGPTATGCLWSALTCISDSLGKLDCAKNLFCECLCLWGSAPSGLVTVRNAVCGEGIDPWRQFEQIPTDGISDPQLLQFVQSINRLRALAGAVARSLGDPVWLGVPNSPQSRALIAAMQAAITPASDGGTRVTLAELSAMIGSGGENVPSPLTTADVQAWAARWNRSVDYYSAGIFDLAQVPAGQSTDFFARDVIDAARSLAIAGVRADQSEGFTGAGDSLYFARQLIQTQRLQQSAGVCARVRIEISQQAVLTRDAFDATLRITNNDQVGTLSMVGATIRVTDDAGLDATDRFLIQAPILTNLGDISGTGMIAPSQTGSAKWIIVPRHSAAPTEPRVFYVEGSFQYLPPGAATPVTVPLFPTAITVRPNPSLTLKYFLERVVYSNDPFTPQVEPAVPFNLGLLVTNTGGGAARDLSLTTSQPRIVENSRGLLIDFRIIGTQLNGRGLSPSLTVDFGNLGPGQTSVAQFLLTSSLQGEFTDFSASFSNLNGLGDPSVSLIDSVTVFSLNHVVRSTRPGSDNLPDFLTDDIPDANNLPDTVHLSDGTVAPVRAVTNPLIDVDTTNLSVRVRISGTPANGFQYVQFTNPFAALNASAVSARRLDGVDVLPGFNLWTTNRIIRRQGEAPRPENLVRLFDFGGPGDYTIRFTLPTPGPVATAWRLLSTPHGAAGPLPLPVYADGSTSEPRRDGVRELRVLFGAPILPATFSPSSVQISGVTGPDNQPVDLSSITFTTDLTDNNTVGIVRLSSTLPDRARYCLSLSGVRNFLNEPAAENGSVSFTTLVGDVFGDRRVNNTDVGAVTALLGTPLSADSPVDAIRADVDLSGAVDQGDVAIVLARRRTEARFLMDPCPPPLNAPRDVGVVGAMPDSAWTPGPVRGVKTTSDWWSRSLSDEERAYLLGEGATRAYAAAGSVIPLVMDASRLLIRVGEDADLGALRSLGLNTAAIKPIGVDGWSVIPTGVRGVDLAAARIVLDSLTSAGFTASPVFVDSRGRWMAPGTELHAVLLDGADEAALLRSVGARVVARDAYGAKGLLRLAPADNSTARNGQSTLALANRLAASTSVRLAEPLWIISASRGVERSSASALAGAVVGRSSPAPKPGVPVVAIIDDGVEPSRPDVLSLPARDATLDGAPDPSTPNPAVYGTLAAGLIGFTDAQFGQSVTVLPVRALADGSLGAATSTRWLARALALSAQGNARVTLTGPSIAALSDTLAWVYARTREPSATGTLSSSGMLHLAPVGDDWSSSAIAMLPAVLPISAVDTEGSPAPFAAPVGRVGLVAVGVDAETADARAAAGLVPGDRVRTSGTLLSAARVARSAALVSAADSARTLGPAALERALRITASRPVGKLSRDALTATSGWGLVDERSALRLLAQPMDFNADGQRDEADLMALLDAIATGTYSERLDINGDGVLDEQDVSAWFDKK